MPNPKLYRTRAYAMSGRSMTDAQRKKAKAVAKGQTTKVLTGQYAKRLYAAVDHVKAEQLKQSFISEAKNGLRGVTQKQIEALENMDADTLGRMYLVANWYFEAYFDESGEEWDEYDDRYSDGNPELQFLIDEYNRFRSGYGLTDIKVRSGKKRKG